MNVHLPDLDLINNPSCFVIIYPLSIFADNK